MNSTLKNVAGILIVFTLVFFGYYVFIQKDGSVLNPALDSVNQDLFADVQKYIERRQVLDSIKLDTYLFSDERFSNLVDYTPEVPVRPESGRENPFDEV